MLKSLFHWKVLVNLLLAVAVFTGLVWLTFRWLEYHTHHGKEIPVPNVINRSVHDAIKILDDSGLDYEVDSFKYDPKYRPFQVLRLYPSPGSRVKGGRTVRLVVNPRTWAKITVPDIIDRYKGLAFRQLEQVGLKVGDTIFEPNIQRDAVIRMLYNGSTLKPGSLLPRFSTIDLVIGSGPKRNISIPNVVGLTVAQAKAIIANNLFEVGLVEFEDGGNDENDIVYYQDPGAGDIRDQGMQIDLWASKKTPAELRGKINYLNSIYRIKIDTTLPPVRYEEAPVYYEDVPPSVSEPSTTPAPRPSTPTPAPNPAPKSATTPTQPRPGMSQTQPKTTTPKPSGTTPTQPKNSTTDKPATTQTQPVKEKPKVKKVVVE